eukprot:8860090-Pyramimonas_sp.AAC.1
MTTVPSGVNSGTNCRPMEFEHSGFGQFRNDPDPNRPQRTLCRQIAPTMFVLSSGRHLDKMRGAGQSGIGSTAALAPVRLDSSRLVRSGRR